MADTAQKSDSSLPSFPIDKSYALFCAFDEAAAAEARRAPPVTFEESIARLSELIDVLPQRPVIRDDHAQRWIEETYRNAAERMKLEGGEEFATVANIHDHVFWHVRRASGFGGSDAGIVHKHFKGELGNFGNARTLVLQKLLVLAPEEGTEETSRGVRAEPVIREMYHRQTGAKTDEDALNRLKGFRWAKRPASIGTPDDTVIHRDGRRHCLDYKAPSAAVIQEYLSNGVSFEYQCQLHHYCTLAIASGSKFDLMSIEAHDPASWKVLSFEVPFNKDLAIAIADHCHILWHRYVMNGVAPDVPKPDELRIEDEVVLDLAAQATFWKLLQNDIEANQKRCIEQISALGSEWHELSTGVIKLDMANLSRKRAWNEGKLLDIARTAGVDPDRYMIPDKGGAVEPEKSKGFMNDLYAVLDKPDDLKALLDDFRAEGVPLKRKLDADKLAAALEEQGIPTTEAAEVRETFRLTAKKKGPEKEKLELAKLKVAELSASLEEIAEREGAEIIRGEHALSEEEDDVECYDDMAP